MSSYAVSTPPPVADATQQYQLLHSKEDRMAQVIADRAHLELRCPRVKKYSKYTPVGGPDDCPIKSIRKTFDKACELLSDLGYEARCHSSYDDRYNQDLVLSVSQKADRGESPSQSEVVQVIINELVTNLLYSKNGKYETSYSDCSLFGEGYTFRDPKDVLAIPVVETALREQGYEVKVDTVPGLYGDEKKIEVAFPEESVPSSSKKQRVG